jgi:hypothetical protein
MGQRIKTYLNCTNCGSSAVTLNKRTCISIKSGKICNGKIIKVKGLLVVKTPASISEKGKYKNPVYLGFWRQKN